MGGPAPALICTVLTDLFGFALFYPWDPVRMWKSRWRIFFLLAYFIVLLTAIVVLIYVWPVNRSHFDLQLLLELSLLNGLSVEAVFLWRIFSIPDTLPIFRILVPTLATIAGLLLVVGPGASFHNKTIGRYIAFAGCLLFHVSAAAVFSYHLRYELARHRKLIRVSVTYGFAALGGFSFLRISDGYMFLLANCILECVVNLILLALALIESYKGKNRVIAASSRDEGSVSARLRLESDSLNTKKATAGNAGRGSLRIEVEQAVTIRIEQYGLPTPPPSPVPAELFISPSDLTPLRPDSKTCKTSCCSILDITVSETCVVHARVLAKWETKNGRVLRLITMDWEKISHHWGLQLEEHIGKTVYDIAERLSSNKSGAGMVLLAERDLCDIGLSPEDCKSLLDGCDLYLSGQVGLVDIPWMSSLL